ncbi:hypothetical protein Daesc_007912 [Daldinia eschscholtzii]|uniref:Uncharacterized protein n=1 Tax=Daldinia eschscholtzii TaxID=292717 RepID=A0AAX6MG29_9PEZI
MYDPEDLVRCLAGQFFSPPDVPEGDEVRRKPQMNDCKYVWQIDCMATVSRRGIEEDSSTAQNLVGTLIEGGVNI